MNLQCLSRKLVVLGVVAVLLLGIAGIASAITIDPRPRIILVGDEEPTAKPGHGMISIGDTIVVQCTVTPNDSVDYIVADMRKYGGEIDEHLDTFRGADGYISNVAFVPICSGEGVGQGTMDIRIVDKRSTSIPTDSWLVCWDNDGGWDVQGTHTGYIGNVATGSEFLYIPNPNDTVFAFTITDVANICCLDGTCSSCDHFEFETHAAVQSDTVWMDTLVVADADSFWIDNTPCDYYGHDDPTVLVTAVALGGYTDTLSSYPPQNQAGAWINYDTHWTTYMTPWVRLYPTEYEEDQDYFFGFNTDEAGFGPIFGEEDNILNPANPYFGLSADECTVYVDVRKLAHENGNDDILYFAWDAHLLGLAYADTNWWHAPSPFYGSVDCTPPYGDNGVPPTAVYRYIFPILEDSTDVPAGEQLPMIWISDSGDTTWFPTFTKTLAAIDNQVPNYHDPAVTDSVMPWDISFYAKMDNAGEPDVLNPVSVGNPIADWLQVQIDLEGLFDLNDVYNDTDPGRLFASFYDIGYYLGVDTPMGSDYLAPMHPLSPIYGSDSIDVLASPPSPYPMDEDSVRTFVWIFDNAGNTFYVGAWDTMLAVDNELPFVDAGDCSTNHYIWTEIDEDVAFKPRIANVGMPEYNIHGNEYVDRDRIVLHANLGAALGADEIRDVVLLDNPYCNDPVPFLYDNGLDGADAVLGDKNYTGQTRIQVAGILPGVCILDTDDEEQGFEVLVTDDAGNAAINTSCIQPPVDNEPPWMSPEHVAIMFWDDPETFGVDGDVNGDGKVTVGDQLIFEWRAQDEVIEDGEIDSVRVNLESIDPTWSGWLNLYWRPPGGIYRNWWPDVGPSGGYPPGAELFTVPGGSIDGETLCADFKVWDNAGNTNGWQNFCSDLILDNVSSIIDCAMFDFSVSGPDTIAAVGDTICFAYAGPDEDVEDITVHLYGVAGADSILYLTKDGGAWTGCFVVDDGVVDEEHYFEVITEDDVGNLYSCFAGPVAIDNMIPWMACNNVLLRLFDYVNLVPYRVVNVGDNLTAGYWDTGGDDGDVVKVTADFSNYSDSIGVVNLVPEFDGGELYYWGYRIDPVPDGHIDEGPGGLQTMVHFEAWDDAGNYNDMWVCPKRIQLGRTPNPVLNPPDANLICNSECVAVDTERPEPVDPDAITFELLESSNNIANVGDRLNIIVNMGDPTASGYDMYWEYGFVQADIHQYGDEYQDLDDYLFLTDRAFSAGGEGDGQFSYHFYYQTAQGGSDGQTLVEGVPILPGETVLPAEDDSTRIKVRAMDDAGNFSLTWTYSDWLKHSVTHEYVPVDNELPTIEAWDIGVTYVDNDDNGIYDIGDSVTVTVDMTDAPGGDVAGVWANLYDWGYPSMDKVPLTAHSPVYSVSFKAVRNPGNYCEDGVLLEDDVMCEQETLLGATIIHPQVEVMAQDMSGNWSDYEWIGPVDDQPFVPEVYPQIDEWPFMPDWTESFELDIIADTDAPDPLNPTFNDYDSDIRAYSLQDGTVGLKLFYDKDVRNQDVERFFVYGDLDTPGEVDWNTFLGEPIPVDDIPSSFYGMMHRTYVWVSEPLPERTEPYHFGVLAVDNAGNMSDWTQTWITGTYADTTSPTGFVQAFDENDHPTDLGDDDAYFLGYLHSDYYEIVYNEWYARIQDIDPMTEGNQPGEWKLIDEDGSWPVFPPYNYIEAPYDAYAYFLDCAADGGHPEDCFDLVPGGCYTFEVCMIPWDTEGNHIMPDDAEKFVFTYDNWAPVMTSWSVDGHPSPSAERWVVGDELDIEATATDGCDMTENLTWELWLLEVHGSDTMIPISSKTVPVGEAYKDTMDLANYPQGDLTLGLLVRDEVGNEVTYTQPLEIQDTTAPEGRFAFWREAAIFQGHHSHPEYLKILDGMRVMGRDAVDLTFWVRWPGEVPPGAYDVGEVSISCQMADALDGEWTHVATLTDYDDTFDFGDIDENYWFGYNFAWDTSMFENGAEVTLKAEVMDEVGNTTTQMVNVVIDNEYPVLAIDVPEAMDVCGEMRVKGPFNLTATETTNPVDTYYALWAYKSHDFPDVGDCWPFDSHGWRFPIDSLMILDLVTPETIWRATVDPATEDMEDGAYDFVVLTEDVAGNWSWDKDRNFCVDPGYFAEALANGMGMTIVIDNEAPEVRIRSVDTGDHLFQPIDEGWLWPMLPYVQADGNATVTSWTESDCDVAMVRYFLEGDEVINGSRLVGESSDDATDYMVTFPTSGGVDQYLIPGALQNGFVVLYLRAELTDMLGNVSNYYVDFTILDVEPASAFLTMPAPGAYVSHNVLVQANAVQNDEIYDVTYQFRPASTKDDGWMDIGTSKAHNGAPWNIDANGDTIKWETDLLADGQYELRAVARDAGLQTDPDPATIMVWVDNTPPEIAGMDVTPRWPEALKSDPTFIGGAYVEISGTATDAMSGVKWFNFYYKTAQQSYDDATLLSQDRQMPYYYKWQGSGFTGLTSGWYDLLVSAEDMAGNIAYYGMSVYVDQWAPDGWVTAPEPGSNVSGTVTLSGVCEDNVPMNQYVGQAMNSGLKGAQFQYRPSGSGLLESEPMGDWIDLGGMIEGEGPGYTMDWNTLGLTGGSYDIRIVGIDNVDNRADVDGQPTLPYITINVVDNMPATAVIAGVDPVSGYVWAAPVIHGPSNDIGFVRFEYMSADGPALKADGALWTTIGEVEHCTDGGLYGLPWHTGGLTGDFWVRAVAYDDDYDVVEFPDLYDETPAQMKVTIASDGTVTMADTEEITSLRRWGNIARCDWVASEVVSEGKPTLIVVYDDDPEDHFNTPWGWLRHLERPDDPTVWVDDFDLNDIDPWGNVTIIATYNDGGVVGAKTEMIKVFKVNEREGTKGAVSQDGMTVDIPSGAFNGQDGLLVINVPDLMADPSLDDPMPIGNPVMMTLLDYGNCDHYFFQNGVRAEICMEYDVDAIPEGYDWHDAKIAFWDQDEQEWIFDGGVEITHTVPDSGEVCCYVDQTGTYSVVIAPKLRITTPVFDPRCGTYTGAFPRFCSIIEDLAYDYVDEIKVVLNGPSADPIFDDMTIYHGSGGAYDEGVDWFSEVSYGAGWFGTYDAVANRLCMRLVDPDVWSTYWDYWYDYDEWFMFYGDVLSKGLPAGNYTLDIWAQNEMGDTEHMSHPFTVDATPPQVAFVGEYVAPNPSFHLMLTDMQSGVDESQVYLDVFAVAPYGSDTEYEELLGTATPSAMEFTEGENSVMVNFGDMVYHGTLPHNMAIDVVVYDGVYENYTGDCSYGECRRYANDHGVPDCAENHATPVWRRFTVDGEPPTMTITSEESASEVELQVCDETSGIDTSAFMIREKGGALTPIRESGYDWSWRSINNHCGVLTIDFGDATVKIDVQASDKAGNFDTITIDKGGEVVDVFDMKVYPNPFSPADGEYARIAYTLSRAAQVTIKIYDFAGVPVKTVVEDYRGPGGHVEKWYGGDESGNTVAPGAYIGFVKVDDGSKIVTKNLKIAVGHGK